MTVQEFEERVRTVQAIHQTFEERIRFLQDTMPEKSEPKVAETTVGSSKNKEGFWAGVQSKGQRFKKYLKDKDATTTKPEPHTLNEVVQELNQLVARADMFVVDEARKQELAGRQKKGKVLNMGGLLLLPLSLITALSLLTSETPGWVAGFVGLVFGGVFTVVMNYTVKYWMATTRMHPADEEWLTQARNTLNIAHKVQPHPLIDQLKVVQQMDDIAWPFWEEALPLLERYTKLAADPDFVMVAHDQVGELDLEDILNNTDESAKEKHTPFYRHKDFVL